MEKDFIVRRRNVIFAFLVTLSSCDFNSEINCTDEAVAGIQLNVFEKQSKQPVYCGLSVTFQDSSYEEIINTPSDENCYSSNSLLGAFERPGLYNITVNKAGYESWYAYNVEVIKANECHVETISVDVNLVKL